MVYHCLYLYELCTLVADMDSLKHLWSVCQNEHIMRLCHVTNWPVRADVLSVSQIRQSGILWQIICVIWPLNSTVFSVS